MMVLYSLALSFVLAISSPWWVLQMLRGGRYRAGLWERLGQIRGEFVVPRGGLSGVVWIHAVSVGEVLAASRLVGEMEAAGHTVVISTTTEAGQKLARDKFGAERVFYFPLDFAFAVRRWLRAVRPSLVVLMESEMWPRFLVECERAAVPVVVANARVSDRSYPRYMRLRRLWAPLLRKVRLVLAQSEEDARRWREIGAPRVESVGNLKYDVRAAGETELVRALRASVKTPVLVAGSTLAGEEAALLDCWRQMDAVMVLAPRHPQRFDEVERLLRERGVAFVRLSEWRLRSSQVATLGSVAERGFSASPSQVAAMAPVEMTDGLEGPDGGGGVVEAPVVMTTFSDGASLAAGTILLVDSIGELASLYQLATVAFVGGSVVDAGGHNPLEPAQFGVPVVMGPHYANFRAMVDAMRAADAVQIVNRDDLCAVLRTALEGEATGLKEMGRRGQRFFEAQAGATARTCAAIEAVLAERSSLVGEVAR